MGSLVGLSQSPWVISLLGYQPPSYAIEMIMYSRLHNVCRNQKATNAIIIVRVSSAQPDTCQSNVQPSAECDQECLYSSCVKLLIKKLLEELYVPL